MPSSYPGGYDALSNPTSTDPMNSGTVPHAAQHANANNAIEAIQGELGLDPAGAEATVRARLDAIDTTIGGLGGGGGLTLVGTYSWDDSGTYWFDTVFAAGKHYRFMVHVLTSGMAAGQGDAIYFGWRASAANKVADWLDTKISSQTFYSPPAIWVDEAVITGGGPNSQLIADHAYGAETLTFAVFDVFNPNAALPKFLVGTSGGSYYDGTTDTYSKMTHIAAVDQLATAADGFYVTSDNYGATGTVTVWEYA